MSVVLLDHACICVPEIARDHHDGHPVHDRMRRPHASFVATCFSS
jgi:hypothetical protein